VSAFKKYFFRTLAVILFVAIGFYRDHFFVNLNYQLTTLYYHNSDYVLPNSLFFLEGMDYMQLYYLKYPMTGVFIILYFSITLWAVHLFFGEKKYRRWVWFSYIIITFGAGLLFLVLYLFSGYEGAYPLTRKLLEFAESPLMAMLLFPVILLDKKLNTQK
jgi:hypothetical protein